MLSPNTILQNRYRIVRELGHGGMGTVYEAIDQRVNSIVALKETFTGGDENARRAFEREAALLANLRHPALPKVMDYFSENDGEFLVMEYVSGSDLGELLEQRDQPFPAGEVIVWAVTVLGLLDYLHSREPPIVHRDIKPANLKVSDRGEIFLLDFGLAKGAAGQMPTVGMSRSVRGYTPAYAPIEQIAGRGTDPRSDLYSLGATMYQLLTSQTPLDAPTRYAVIDDGEPDPLIPAAGLNRNIPSELSETIGHAMAISRRDRPSSAKEMRDGLMRAAQAIEKKGEPKTIQLLGPQQAVKESSIPTASAETVPAEAHSASPRPELTISANQFLAANAPRSAPETVAGLRPPKNRRTQLILILVATVGIATLVVLALMLKRRPVIATVTSTTNNQSTPSSTPYYGTRGTVVAALNGVPVQMELIPAGEFIMGSDNDDSGYAKPAHRVTIGQFFYMGTFEVTQLQWRQMMGSNPSTYQCDYCPVETIDWDDAQAFLRKLNGMHDGLKYRLPTEAEWEYACRAGTTGDYAGSIGLMGWSVESSGNTTHPVGQLQPNGFGLYDMHGNVEEWCEDEFQTDYTGAPADGRTVSMPGKQFRVVRGGGYGDDVKKLRSWARGAEVPTNKFSFAGMRVVAVNQKK